MRAAGRRFGGAAWALLFAVAAWAQTPEGEGEKPLDTGIVERAGERLIQLDVSFIPKEKGDSTELPSLAAEDFELVINARRIPIAHADRICQVLRSEVAAPTGAGTPAPPVAPRPAETARPATFVFYLEHSLLTMAGQSTAFEMAEQLVRDLIVGGNRGMVVSSGARIMQSPLSSDPKVLLATLRDAGKSLSQWGECQYAEREAQRYEEMFAQPRVSLVEHMARSFSFEETRITASRLRRLSAFLGGLGQIDPPKALFYFADMVRKVPGAHYLEVAGLPAGFVRFDERVAAGDAPLAHSFAFDDLLDEANAQGVRLYTIQSQGLKPPAGSPSQPLLSTARDNPVSPVRNPRTAQARIVHAEDTMVSLGAETGGDMFFGGTDASTMGKIKRAIAQDLGCIYIVSFHAGKLREDSPLRVLLRLSDTPRGQNAAGRFTIRTRGQLVIQSAARLQRSRVLSALVATSGLDTDPGRGAVVPLGFEDGAYQGLAQFAVLGADWAQRLVERTDWELGMTQVAGTEVEDQVSTRVTGANPSTPVILERVWSFRPGQSEVVSVGHERRIGQLATARIELEWPDPDKDRASISPIEIVQEAVGQFVRREGGRDETRTKGTLAVGGGLVRVDQPAYVVALVCRGPKVKDALWVRRRLSGSSAADFGALEWRFDGERCIQLRDLVHAGQLEWGDFEYAVEVYDNAQFAGAPLARRRRSFAAVAPQETAAK